MMRGSNSLDGPVVRSGGPAYQQISEVLTDEIFRQTWKVGEPLPNEKNCRTVFRCQSALFAAQSNRWKNLDW